MSQILFTCQQCGADAPTREVSLHQNIGLLIFRLSESTEGHLCRRCISETVRRYTFVNLTLGWWGLISFFVTPFFLLFNLIQYLAARRLPRDPIPGKPRLSDELLIRLASYKTEITECLGRGDSREMIAIALAEMAQVTPAQALLYLSFDYQ